MGRKRTLGDGAQVLPITGGEAIATVADAPQASSPRRRRQATVAEPAAPARVVTTTLRLTEEHHKALRQYAFERAEKTGGRFDVSAALRDVLSDWLARR